MAEKTESGKGGDGDGGLSVSTVERIVNRIINARAPQIAKRVAQGIILTLLPASAVKLENGSLVLSEPLKDLLADPAGYILGTVLEFVVANILRPPIEALAAAGAAVIRAVTVVFLGGDLQLSPTGAIGLADIPLWIAARFTSAGAEVGGPVVAFFEAYNAQVAAVAAQAGVAGPAIAVAIYGATGLAFMYVLWSIIQVIDIPFISLSGALRVLTTPVRKLLEVTR